MGEQIFPDCRSLTYRSGPHLAASLESRRGLLAVLLAVAYVSMLPVIGFYVMTFVVFCLLAMLLAPGPAGFRKLPMIMFTGALACLAFYLLFQKMFHVPFPEGILI